MERIGHSGTMIYPGASLALRSSGDCVPVEPVWSHPKRSLANLAKRNLAQLTALVAQM